MIKLFKRRRRRKVLVVGLDCAPPAALFHTSDENSLGLKDQLPNLGRLIDELTLSYHVARQHAITMEMLDLVAGAGILRGPRGRRGR